MIARAPAPLHKASLALRARLAPAHEAPRDRLMTVLIVLLSIWTAFA